jgi:hypothetical protein
MRRKPAQTFQDLIDWNFIIITNSDGNNVFYMLEDQLGKHKE